MKIVGAHSKQKLILYLMLAMVINIAVGANFFQITFNKAVTYLREQNFPINENFYWQEFEAASIHISREKISGFYQFCNRLRGDFRSFTICVDLEFRVICIYDPTKPASEREVHYFKWG